MYTEYCLFCKNDELWVAQILLAGTVLISRLVQKARGKGTWLKMQCLSEDANALKKG